MSWQLFAILSIVFSAVYNILAKLGATKMNVIASNMAISAASLFVAALIFLVSAPIGSLTASGPTPLIYSILSGLSVGAYAVFYMFSLSKSAPISVALPLVFGGSIVLTAILGVVFLGESVSYLKAAGLTFIIIGLALLSR